jgi:hypothetical protein
MAGLLSLGTVLLQMLFNGRYGCFTDELWQPMSRPCGHGDGACSIWLLPILPVESYLTYSRALHFASLSIENHAMGPMLICSAGKKAETVADVYNMLSPEDRKQCAIFAQNFGQAGVIDFFGAKLDLPNAILAATRTISIGAAQL